MEFNVKFESTTDYAVNLNYMDYGLNQVERIRQELNLPNLPLSVFYPGINSYNVDYTIRNLPENLVKKSNRFKETNQIIVKTPVGYLNAFAKISYKTYQKDNGEIIKVKLFYEIQESSILSLWESLGFPLEI